MPLLPVEVPVPRPLAASAQPEAQAGRIASKAMHTRIPRRRTRRASAKGASSRPQSSGRTGHAVGREERAVDCVNPVAIATTTVPFVLAATASVEGLKVQEDEGGSRPHWKAKRPCEPFSGVIAMLK